MFEKIFYLLTIFTFFQCKDVKNTTVIFNDTQIEYQGRIHLNLEKKATELYWPGTSLKINFKGTKAAITLEDERGENYFNLFIDGKFKRFIKLEKGKKTYLLAENLSETKHTLEITKRNEWVAGKTLFYKFEIEGEPLKKDTKSNLSIEFYGDSITVGHGNEDYSGKDESNGLVTNNYQSYAAITARNLNADYTCIARGGIGILVSWHEIIMQEMYYRKNPADKNSVWDFTKKQPEIVVVNLLQNDSWLINLPKHKEFKRRFGAQKPTAKEIETSYTDFLKTIRKHYLKANIICVLGNMDITKENSPWPNYVNNALQKLNDAKIFTCIVPFKNTTGHPKVAEHRIIAEQLTTFIKKEIL